MTQQLRRFVFTCVVDIDPRLLDINDPRDVALIAKSFKDDIDESLAMNEDHCEVDSDEPLYRVSDPELKEVLPCPSSAATKNASALETNVDFADGVPSTAAADSSHQQKGWHFMEDPPQVTEVIPFQTELWTKQGRKLRPIGPAFTDHLGHGVYCVFVGHEHEPAVRLPVADLLANDPSALSKTSPKSFAEFSALKKWVSHDDDMLSLRYGVYEVELDGSEWAYVDHSQDVVIRSESLDTVERELYELLLRRGAIPREDEYLKERTHK